MYYFRFILLSLWFTFCSFFSLIIIARNWKKPNAFKKMLQFYGNGALKITNMKPKITGLENLEKKKPAIYLLNHQSTFDIAIMGTFFPENTVVIGKRELQYIPVIGIIFAGSGNIMIDRKKHDKAMNTISQVTNEIKKRGVSVFIFPEGTRNKKEEGFLPFKKGAFNMAVDSQIPIIPIISSELKRTSNSGKRLIRMNESFKVKILEPFDTKGLSEKDVPDLTTKVWHEMRSAYDELNQ